MIVSITVWQKPYLPILKHRKWSRRDLILAVGDVKEELDRQIGKTVLKIHGAAPASNCVQIPASNSRGGLGVAGQILYMMVCRPVGKSSDVFTIHLDCIASNSRQDKVEKRVPFKMVFRLSFSNMYKSIKMTGQTIQIPLTLEQGRWTVLAIDMGKLIHQLVPLENFMQVLKEKNNKVKQGERGKRKGDKSKLRPLATNWKFESLRSLKMGGAALTVWTMFSSDNAYSPFDLPREMKFPGLAENWHEMYNWQELPQRETWHQEEGILPKSDNNFVPETTYSHRNVKKSAGESNRNWKKGLAEMNAMIEKRQDTIQRHMMSEDDCEIFPTEVLKVKPPSVVAKSGSKVPKDNNMDPDPILELERLVAFSRPNSTGGRTACWVENGKSIAYAASNIIVIMNIETRNQKFLMGHTDRIISLVSGCNGGHLIASAQGGQTPIVRIWSTLDCTCKCYMNVHEKDVTAIAFSPQNKFLVISGHDSKGRMLLSVWDTSAVEDGKRAVEIARQLCEFDVKNIKFSPYMDESSPRLVSCGNSSIRFWRVSRGHLPGRSVPLEPQNRQKFTDICFNLAFKPNDEPSKRVFVSSEEGWIFQVNYLTGNLECIFRVHDGPINSMMVNPGFCVTGSEDRFVRIWPLEFLDFYMQVQFMAAVHSIDISPDGLSVLVGTKDGCLGILDLQTSKHTTIVRSHTDRIRSVVIDPNSTDQLTTVSEDGSIRIWSFPNLEQVYQFDCNSGEKIISAAYHPQSSGVIACGFSEGSVRICDIKNAGVEIEYQQHKGEVVKVAYGLDGRHLLSLGQDATICVYDCNRKYEPTCTIRTCPSHPSMSVDYVPDLQKMVILYKAESHPSILNAMDICSMQKIHQIDCKYEILHAEFSPDRKEIAVITKMGTALRFSSASGSLIGSYVVPKALISQEASSSSSIFTISPQNRYTISGSVNQVVGVWEYRGSGGIRQARSLDATANSMTNVQMFSGHDSPVMGISMLPDSSRVVSVAGNSIFLWKFFGKDIHPENKLVQTLKNKMQSIRKFSDDSYANDSIDYGTISDEAASVMTKEVPANLAGSDKKHSTTTRQTEQKLPSDVDSDGANSPASHPVKKGDDKGNLTETSTTKSEERKTAKGKQSKSQQKENTTPDENKEVDGGIETSPLGSDERETTLPEPLFSSRGASSNLGTTTPPTKAYHQPILPSFSGFVVAERASSEASAKSSKLSSAEISSDSKSPSIDNTEKNAEAATSTPAGKEYSNISSTPMSEHSHLSVTYSEPRYRETVRKISRPPTIDQQFCLGRAENMAWNQSSGILAHSCGNLISIRYLRSRNPSENKPKFICAHHGAISSLSLSPDGKYLLSTAASYDPNRSAYQPDEFLMRFFDTCTGTPVLSISKSQFCREIKKTEAEISNIGVQFAKMNESSNLIAAILDGNIRSLCVWRIETMQHSDGISKVARICATQPLESSHSEMIVTSEADGSASDIIVTMSPVAVELWVLSETSGEKLTKITANVGLQRDERCSCIDIISIASKRILLIGTTKGKVHMLELSSKAPANLGSFLVSKASVLSSLYSTPMGYFSVVSQSDNTINTFYIRGASKSSIEVLRTHQTSVKFPCVRVTTDADPSVAIASDSNDSLWFVDLLEDKASSSSSSSSSQKEKGKLPTQNGTLLISGHSSTVRKALFSGGTSGDEYLVSCDEDGALALWDLHSSTVGHRLVQFQVAGGTACLSLAMHPKVLICASSYSDGIIRIVDLENLTLKARIQACSEPISAVAFLHEGNTIVAGTTSGKLMMIYWPRSEILLEKKMAGGISELALLPTDKSCQTFMAIQNEGKRISIWKGASLLRNIDILSLMEASQGDVVLELNDDSYKQEKISKNILDEFKMRTNLPRIFAEFFPGKNTVIVICVPPEDWEGKSRIIFYDFAENLLLKMATVPGYVTSFAVSPTGNSLALGCLDQTLRYVNQIQIMAGDSSDLKEKRDLIPGVHPIAYHFDWVTDVDFSADGNFVLSSSYSQLRLTKLK